MPELPEIECSVRRLRPRLLGERISGIKVLWPRTLFGLSEASAGQELIGGEVQDIFRKGKFIFFEIKAEKISHCCLHLRMSGRLEFRSSTDTVEKHDRLQLHFESGKNLAFHDVRKFGRWYSSEKAEEIAKNIGIDPTSDDFQIEIFQNLLQNLRTRIKSFLLDQRKISGIGNIYCDEALWKAGIHPERSCASLKTKEVQALYEAIQIILLEAIKNGGTDFGDQVVIHGMHEPLVYGRKGKPCPRCKSTIERIVVAQRSSHFCPKCQKNK